MITRLFHWSPADRYRDIIDKGLKPGSDNTVASGKLHYLCASTLPDQAWLLSGATDWCADIDLWDLWVIAVAPTDELHVRPFFGTVIEEIKIRNPIPADRLWWAGRRDNAGVPTSELPYADPDILTDLTQEIPQDDDEDSPCASCSGPCRDESDQEEGQ